VRKGGERSKEDREHKEKRREQKRGAWEGEGGGTGSATYHSVKIAAHRRKNNTYKGSRGTVV
jgi:hypothetical protein